MFTLSYVNLHVFSSFQLPEKLIYYQKIKIYQKGDQLHENEQKRTERLSLLLRAGIFPAAARRI